MSPVVHPLWFRTKVTGTIQDVSCGPLWLSAIIFCEIHGPSIACLFCGFLLMWGMRNRRCPVPRTRSKLQAHAPVFNGPVGEVISLSKAAVYMRLPEAEVIRLVHAQG